MTIEVRALGSACNLHCRYCYRHLQRAAGNETNERYELSKILDILEQSDKPFTLFGGEALLMSESDLERLWRLGYEKFGENGIQTNGTLITDSHVEMFKKYQVNVGFSIDGPDELNDARWAGGLEETRRATARSLCAMERMAREGVRYNLIVVLHRGNAAEDKLPAMCEWFRKLDAEGLTSVRLLILQDDSEEIRWSLGLSPEENIGAFIRFYELEQELPHLKFDIFTEMESLLLGKEDSTTCVWNSCDPYTTSSVIGIEGDGQISICGRADKDGLNTVKCDLPGYERYIALYQVPYEYGGCKDCRFFLVCRGHCPGSALNNDWRNRTRHCEVWKGLLEHVEARIMESGGCPVSTRNDRKELETTCLEAWCAGRNISIAQAIEKTQTCAAVPEESLPKNGAMEQKP